MHAGDRSADARDGAIRYTSHVPPATRCLMEEVAWRVGEPVDDRPRATHPVLALLAQQIHDRSTPDGRTALLAHVPTLTGATAHDPRVGWALVALCARRALAADAPPRVRRVAGRLAARADRASARLERGLRTPATARALHAAAPAIALARLADLGVALRCVLAVAGPPQGPARDRALAELLEAAVATVRGLAPGPARAPVLSPA